MTCTDMTMSMWNQIGKGERRKRSAHQMIRIVSNTLDQLLNGEGWDVNISRVSILCKSLAFAWSERVYYYPYFAKRETDAQGIYPLSVKSRKMWTWALSQVCPVPRLALPLSHGKWSPGAMSMISGWDVLTPKQRVNLQTFEGSLQHVREAKTTEERNPETKVLQRAEENFKETITDNLRKTERDLSVSWNKGKRTQKGEQAENK